MFPHVFMLNVIVPRSLMVLYPMLKSAACVRAMSVPRYAVYRHWGADLLWGVGGRWMASSPLSVARVALRGGARAG